MEIRKCTKCGKEKPVTEFYADSSRPSGKHHWCKKCCVEYSREYRTKNHTVLLENARKHYTEHKEEVRVRRSKRYANNPSVYREAKLKREFGITLEEYDSVLQNQGGVCAICGKVPSESKPLGVDHNHETGKVRGLLCDNCNLILGLAHDNSDILSKAAIYLENSL